MSEKFFKYLKKKLKDDPIDPSDIGSMLEYPARQNKWTIGKKRQYTKNILRWLYDEKYTDYVGTFQMMVKVGEVHQCDKQHIREGFVCAGSHDVKGRPRCIMVPCDDGYGPMQAIQVYFFPWLKKHMKGFTHSENCSGFKERLTRHIREDW